MIAWACNRMSGMARTSTPKAVLLIAPMTLISTPASAWLSSSLIIRESVSLPS
jgi:hypothetical protein